MRLSTLSRLAAFVALLGLAAYATPAQDPSTTDVAAAARKAREQQKNAPPPKKVLTNDDIPSANISAPAPDTADTKTDGKKDAGQAKKGDAEDDPKSEAYWRRRSAKVRGQLDTAEKELDVLQRELNTNQVQYYSDPQKALMEQHDRADINDKTAKIDAKKKEIDGLNQQISDMEDEVRKAGGDPGWVR
jgi:hypothetical protein